MDDHTLEDAILRLDAAVTRAETAFAARRRMPVTPPAAAVDTDLVRRHAALRAGTEAALERLDRLLGPDAR
ncbi:MAG TPA: hypothetical protein VF649_07830 [Sphingomonas sp.]|jgi:hypothetical protein|uniref:hypothetical protein n=1 Tax=Sphingomonas sp. TaxID=28214 RepID=UPI002EDB0611